MPPSDDLTQGHLSETTGRSHLVYHTSDTYCSWATRQGYASETPGHWALPRSRHQYAGTWATSRSCLWGRGPHLQTPGHGLLQGHASEVVGYSRVTPPKPGVMSNSRASPCLRYSGSWAFSGSRLRYPGSWTLQGSLTVIPGHGLPKRPWGIWNNYPWSPPPAFHPLAYIPRILI
jgi:hypothetical protein